ncbi:MAG: arginase family protein [Gemmataceae bacterium]
MRTHKGLPASKPPANRVVVFPLDSFGSPGTSEGARHLGEAVREILADFRRETVPTRANAWCPHTRLVEAAFDTTGELSLWRSRGHRLAEKTFSRGEHLVWLGGNHLSVLPLLDVIANDSRAGVVQLDAHVDIHRFHDTVEDLSHGNFLRHVRWEGAPRVVHLGNRDLLIPAEEKRRFLAEEISAEAWKADEAATLARVATATAGWDRILLDLDVDVFDPGFLPGMARPVPWGVDGWQVLRLMESLPAKKVAGLAISEYSPGRDREDRGLEILAWLLERWLVGRAERFALAEGT